MQLHTSLFILCAFAFSNLTCNASLNAYVYYEDAECVKNNGIAGTLIYAYDDSRMSGQGFVKESYYGPCKYFEGGYHDFMYDAYDGNYMENGYCITCNGLIGCSATQYDCSDFQTSMPANPYTLSIEQSSNNYTSTSDSSDETIPYELVESVENAVYSEVSSSSQGSSPIYALLGAFTGMIALLSMYTTWRVMKRLRRSKASVDTSDFLDGLDYCNQLGEGALT
mmetsp:Transcript_16166/g.19757  ORF Transcript_16166/g.19757 Transcript_16166/m.19757 type:complete len:224 (-) Transcript_16166:294-965(-)